MAKLDLGDFVKYGKLFEIYGSLLSSDSQSVMSMYFDYNMTLVEIAKELQNEGIETEIFHIGVKAVNDEHEIMMITTEGIIIQLRMEDISTLGRITSGVKMINLDKGVKVAKIAKVREKISDGTTEYQDIDEAIENI